jgi:hypothetical protein
LKDGCGWITDGDLDGLCHHLQRVWHEPRTAEATRHRMWEHLKTKHDLDARVRDLAIALHTA